MPLSNIKDTTTNINAQLDGLPPGVATSHVVEKDDTEPEEPLGDTCRVRHLLDRGHAGFLGYQILVAQRDVSCEKIRVSLGAYVLCCPPLSFL